MTPTARVGLALIAKNESGNLPTLLASVEGAFDRVVLVDTGSRDRTVEIFTQWAIGQTEAGALHTWDRGSFKWCDDFAAARRAADELLVFGPAEAENTLPLVDWVVWADCDDEIHGAQNLRAIADRAPADVVAYGAGYDYARAGDNGPCICYLRRERLVRAGAGRWEGRVHEAQIIHGPVEWLPPEVAEWRHRKPVDHGGQSNRRNLKILKRWAKAEPTNARVVGYLGTELAGCGKHVEALPWFERYQALEVDWPEERAQFYRKQAASLFALGRVDEAIDQALEALKHHPTWPDSYLTLAEGYHRRGEDEKAVAWAQRVLELGVPDTLLIINPLDYTAQPHVVLCLALQALGDLPRALEHAGRLLEQAPGHPEVSQAAAQIRGRLKKDRAARFYVHQAQELVQHDEQLKALALLTDALPYYLTEHPEIITCRSQLRERLAPILGGGYDDHYADGGSKPEDPTGADVAGQLPRSHFLARGIAEQIEAA